MSFSSSSDYELSRDDITGWLEALNDDRLRDDAANVIVDYYMGDLLRVVQGRLNQRFRGIVDGEDIANSVWNSFFNGSFKLANRDELKALLANMAIKKTISVVRKHEAEKRDRRREEQFQLESGDEANARVNPKPLEPLKRPYRPPGDVDSHISADSFFEREPLQLMAMGATPDQAEYCIKLFEGLPEDLRTVFSMIMEGFSNKDIGARLDCDTKAVERQIKRLQKRIQERIGELE